MAVRRGTKRKLRRARATHTTRTFTLDELRADRLRVMRVVKKEGGCIVVDNEGKKLFSLWI
jgi:hypothetical protein